MPATKTIAIGTKTTKMEFVVAQPFVEGHVVTADEAKALNQIRAENIGNNFRARVQAHIENLEGAMTEPDLRAAFDKYDQEYVLRGASPGTGRAQLSPLEREARRIAKLMVVKQLAAPSEKYPSGRKQKDVDPEAFEAQVARFAEHEQVLKLAKKNLKEQEALGTLAIEGDVADAAAQAA